MREIILTRGQVALVDDEDYEYLNQFKWYAHKDIKGYYYAKNAKLGNMHRFILQLKDKQVLVDHKDRNTLNNQKQNLRLCSVVTNGYNRKANKNKSHEFKGVFYLKKYKKWGAMIQFNKKRIYLGSYKSIEEAAEAYNKAALKHHGEFACLNKIAG